MSNPNISLTKKVIHAVTQGRGLRGYIGPQGDAAHVHIKWHAEDSTTLLDTPDAYIGIYADNTAADSAVYANYKWFKYKGDKGDPIMQPQGTYVATRTYVPGDYVTKSNKIWLCITVSTGNDPEAANSTYWTELSVNVYTQQEGDPI